jgi:FkbM family methyltransferase
MNRRIRLLFRKVMAAMPLEYRYSLPEVTIKPLDLLLAAYDARGEEITVLQVGACDGTTNDPIYHFIVKGAAKAVLLEPNPFAFVRLQRTYASLANARLIEVAIGDHDGEAYLYRIKQTDKLDSEVDITLQVASFSRKHLEKHGARPDTIERIRVPCRTLSSLVTELGLTKIDLLQIDAEGFDAAVVRMALNLPLRPDCISFEHVHLATSDRGPLFDSLKASGYCLGRDDWNILAMQTSLFDGLKNGRRESPHGQAGLTHA